MKKLFLSLLTLCVFLSACQEVDLNAAPPVFDTGIDPSSWVSIPAGDFLQGQFQELTPLDHSFEIMVTNVTNAQYADYLNAALADGRLSINGNEVQGFYPGDEFLSGRHEVEIKAGEYIFVPVKDDFLRLAYDGSIFTAIPEWSNHPMTMVSWFGAKGYCEYYGWRLPTELEWEKAARGTDGRAFPWGDELERNNANYLSSRDPFENMASFGSRTTPVGFYNGSAYAGYQTLLSTSPYGLYDMAGNVWQWTADIYPKQHYRYMRGGNKDSYENNLRVWVRNNATPTFTSSAVGFRCVRDGD